MTNAQINLKAAIELSQLSVVAFAASVVAREPRTVHRWLSGHAPIPNAAQAKLEAFLKAGEIVNGK